MSKGRKIGILDLLIILLERKWLFIISMVIFSLAGVIVSFVMPSKYKAVAAILPPKKQMPAGLSAMMSDLPVSGLLENFNILGSNNADQFLSILQSRRLAEEAIEEFNLIEYYGFADRKKFYIEEVLKKYYERVEISENKYDNIIIAVTDTNPAFSMNLANFLAKELDKINFELSKERARHSRQFFEDRVEVIQTDLDSATNRFAKFQIENNYIDLDAQVRSSIDALSRVETEQILLDLQIEQLRSQFGSNNQRVQELQKNKAVLERQMNRYMNDGSGELIIALKKAPEKAIEYAYLMRDVKVQETLYKYVLQMYEQAKLTEANNIPSVQVLEWAKLPEKRTHPKRKIICLLFFFPGLIFTTGLILTMKWYSVQKEHQTDAYCKLKRTRELLKFRS